MRSVPNDLTIKEAERFLKRYGYKKARQKGSHRVYTHPTGQMINIQGPIIAQYQVEQIITAVESIVE